MASVVLDVTAGVNLLKLGGVFLTDLISPHKSVLEDWKQVTALRRLISQRGLWSLLGLSSVSGETVRIQCCSGRPKASALSRWQVCAGHEGLGSPAVCVCLL